MSIERQRNLEYGQSAKLREAFQEGGEDDKIKQKQLKGKNQIQWLKDMILFKILDTKNGNELFTFSLTRKSLTREAIQLRVNLSPYPSSIDYVYDNTGNSLSIEDMFLQALPYPVFYVLVSEKRIKPYDISNYTNYKGQTGIFLHFVPYYCSDRSMEVDEITLREWILF